jgi:hypothetical protein
MQASSVIFDSYNQRICEYQICQPHGLSAEWAYIGKCPLGLDAMRPTEDPAGLPYKLSSGLFIKDSINVHLDWTHAADGRPAGSSLQAGEQADELRISNPPAKHYDLRIMNYGLKSLSLQPNNQL